MTTNAYIVIALIIFWGALGTWMIRQAIGAPSGHEDETGYHDDD